MNIARMMASLSMLTMVAAPVASQAAQAEIVREAVPMAEGEQMAGSGFLLPLGFIAGLVALVIIAGDDEDEPASP